MAAPAPVGTWRVNVPKTLKTYRASGLKAGACTLGEQPRTHFHLDRVPVELFGLGDDVIAWWHCGCWRVVQQDGKQIGAVKKAVKELLAAGTITQISV